MSLQVIQVDILSSKWLTQCQSKKFPSTLHFKPIEMLNFVCGWSGFVVYTINCTYILCTPSTFKIKLRHIHILSGSHNLSSPLLPKVSNDTPIAHQTYINEYNASNLSLARRCFRGKRDPCTL